MLGAAAVAQSPPDGTTFLLGTGSTHGTNSSVYAKVNYDPVRDFVPVVLVSVQASTIKLPGVAAPKRSPVLPNEPTIAESGLPGFDTMVWFGLFGPAGTPKPVVDLINRKANAVLASQAVRDSFAKLGIEAVGGSPDVLAAKVPE